MNNPAIALLMNRSSLRTLRPAIYWIAIIIVWTLVQMLIVRPSSVALDWNGWRQADTQSITLNFARDGIDLFHPEIAWGGDGSGLVEAEVQFYPAVVALLLRWTGPAEWPGRLVSALAWSAAATCLLTVLRRRFGWVPALAGASAVLFCTLAIFLSTTVMPDPTALAFYCLALSSFLLFIETERLLPLVIATASLAVSALIKPTALNLGIVEFILVVLVCPRFLRLPALWFSWAVVVVVIAISLWHGYTNYLVSGNSFGVVTPGTDLKFPTLTEIFDPKELAKAGWISIRYCLGVIGIMAAAWVLLRDHITAEEVALGAGATVALLISLRYSAGQPHYHIFTVPLSAWLIAHGTRILTDRYAQTAKTLMLILALFAVGYIPAVKDRVSYGPEPAVLRLAKLASQLRLIAEPGDLIVVRSLDRAYDSKYNRRNNFEDPRGFYLTGLRGWVLPADRAEVDKLSIFARRGARFYIEAAPRLDDPALMAWLLSSGETVINNEDGIILRMNPRG